MNRDKASRAATELADIEASEIYQIRTETPTGGVEILSYGSEAEADQNVAHIEAVDYAATIDQLLRADAQRLAGGDGVIDTHLHDYQVANSRRRAVELLAQAVDALNHGLPLNALR